MSFLLLLFWVEGAPAEFNCRKLPGGCGGMAAKQRVVATETAAVGWAAAAAARAKAVVGWATGTAAAVARPATDLPKADAVLRTTLGSTLARPEEVAVALNLSADVGVGGWLTAHPLQPPRPGATKLTSLGLCLFGVAGVETGHASQHHQTAKSVLVSADSHMRGIVQPAQAAGLQVHIFAHSWSVAGSVVRFAVDRAYGALLAGSCHEDIGRYTEERVTSMVLSIVTVLRLARDWANRTQNTLDLLFVVRHDTFFHRPVNVFAGPSAVDPMAVTTAPWCHERAIAHAPTAGSRHVGRRCYESVPVPHSGLMDGTYFGAPRLLEWYFDTLLLQRVQGFVLDASRRVGMLMPPGATAPLSLAAWQRHYGCNPGSKTICRATLGHNVLEGHAHRLGLAQRGLMRSHPGTISNYHFSLYRTRHFRLDDVRVGADAFLCDGRTPLCERQLAPAELEASERSLIEKSQELEAEFRRTRTTQPDPEAVCGLV